MNKLQCKQQYREELVAKKEIWKPVVGYEGLYEVNNLGTVISLNYKNSGLKKILKSSNKTGGYKTVALSKSGISKNNLLHRVIAQAFIPNTENKPYINHINGITNDNSIENLEWCTCKENNRHSYFILKKQSNLFFENNPAERGAKNKRSKKVNQYTIEGDFVRTWYSIGEATRGTGILQPHICQCCKGKLKYTGGYKWAYA